MFLGAYVERTVGRRMHVWDGECHVHAGIQPVRHRRHAGRPPRRRLPDPPRVRLLDLVMEYVAAGDVASDGVHMLSTGGMLSLRRARRRPARARSSRPRSACSTPCASPPPRPTSSPPTRRRSCRYMKMITLPKLRDALRDSVHEVRVAPATADGRPSGDRTHGRDPPLTPGAARKTTLST